MGVAGVTGRPNHRASIRPRAAQWRPMIGYARIRVPPEYQFGHFGRITNGAGPGGPFKQPAITATVAQWPTRALDPNEQLL